MESIHLKRTSIGKRLSEIAIAYVKIFLFVPLKFKVEKSQICYSLIILILS